MCTQISFLQCCIWRTCQHSVHRYNTQQYQAALAWPWYVHQQTRYFYIHELMNINFIHTAMNVRLFELWVSVILSYTSHQATYGGCEGTSAQKLLLCTECNSRHFLHTLIFHQSHLLLTDTWRLALSLFSKERSFIMKCTQISLLHFLHGKSHWMYLLGSVHIIWNSLHWD